MNDLIQFGLSTSDIEYIKNHYEKPLISSIIYKMDNVILVSKYFQNLGLDVKSLLINRLDVFLIDCNTIKEKILKYKNTDVLDLLKNDFSIFDNLF